jgi:predicted  nucleic acid-binding Zn-ribbon protein
MNYNEARKAKQDAKAHLDSLLNQVEYVNLRSEIQIAIEKYYNARQTVDEWEELLAE